MIGAEVFSRILDFKDRTTCVLFGGDGAGAVVLEASDQPGHPGERAACRRPPCRDPLHAGHRLGRQVLGDPLLKMDGQAVFKLAVGVLERSAARAVLAKAGRSDADIDWLIRTRPTSASCRARPAS